jgi:hypothetical protein
MMNATTCERLNPETGSFQYCDLRTYNMYRVQRAGLRHLCVQCTDSIAGVAYTSLQTDSTDETHHVEENCDKINYN